MRHIVATALRVAATVVPLAACVLLIAGKDDIRRFRRMRGM